MTRPMVCVRVAVLAGAFAASAHAQVDTARRPGADSARRASTTLPLIPVGPPVRRISTASAVSSGELLGSVNAVRQLPDGRILLNDGQRRRLLLLDTTLALVDVVLDSLSETANFYGTRAGGLIQYHGDTSVFVDPAAYAMILIDEHGKMGRVRSVPRAQDAASFAGTNNGIPGVDARGRIIFRMYAEAGPPKVAPPPGTPWFPQEADSAFIVGVDIETRRLDTVGVIRIPRQENSVKISPGGGFNFTSVTNPLPSTDEWAVLPDGTIAMVRGRDYRVDFIMPNGTRKSSTKLPYDWQHLREEDKQAIVDSVRAVQTKQAMSGYIISLIRWVNQYDREYPKDLVIPKDFVLPFGYQKAWKFPAGVAFRAKYIYGCAAGEEPVMIQDSTTAATSTSTPLPGINAPGAMTGTPSCIPGPVVVAGGVAPPEPQLRTNGVMPPDEMPDYRPPFQVNSVRADGDGNLWVRINTAKPIPGGSIFDIISHDGVLVDRVQIPQGFTVAGFGAGRIVFLTSRDAKGLHLARVRLK